MKQRRGFGFRHILAIQIHLSFLFLLLVYPGVEGRTALKSVDEVESAWVAPKHRWMSLEKSIPSKSKQNHLASAPIGLPVALMARMEYVASLDTFPMQVANSVKFDDDETTKRRKQPNKS